VILYAYSKGIIFSRRIAQCCCDNVVFMALSADSRPHFTTIADFVSSLQEEIVALFRHVLQICMELELVEGSMFAIDGVKLPSNASKEWSGTKADLQKKREKLEAALRYMVEQHRKRDKTEENESEDAQRFSQRLARARAKIEKIDHWLTENDDKSGSRGRIVQSNLTDNESAKMKTGHGVVQGYNNIAVVDAKHQVIIYGESHGIGQDSELLRPSIEGAESNLQSVGEGNAPLKKAIVLADTGFHSTANVKLLLDKGINGYVPDNNYRLRDPRFATKGRHRVPQGTEPKLPRFGHEHFTYDKKQDRFRCPSGFYLHRIRTRNDYHGLLYRQYASKHLWCSQCASQDRCLASKKCKVRTLFVRVDEEHQYVRDMCRKIDTTKGRFIYSKRMGIVEPVFGNIRWAKGLTRLTLRGKRKVSGQWLLYCLVHNIEKIFRSQRLCFA
jgi:hypothetical protein